MIFAKNCYTSLRRKREEFRDRLLNEIKRTKKEKYVTTDESKDLTEEDSRYLRYEYMTHFIGNEHILPIAAEVLNAILTLVPNNWRQRFPDLTLAVINEIKKYYTFSIKRAIVDFVFQQNMSEDFLKQKVHDILPSVRCERIRKFQKIRQKLKNSLKLYHPCIRKSLDLWFREFNTMRQIDKQTFLSYGKSYELKTFNFQCTQMLSNATKLLDERWILRIANIFQNAIKKGTLQVEKNEARAKQLFKCLAVMMEDQLRTVCSKSIDDYMECLLSEENGCNFSICMAARSDFIGFEPSFKVLSETLLAHLNSIFDSVKKHKRIDVELLLNIKIAKHDNLTPNISNDILEIYSEKIIEFIEKHKTGPELLIQDFVKYLNLINMEEIIAVKSFLKAHPPHTFEEYKEQIKKYHKLSRNILLEFEQTTFLDRFEVDKKDLIQYMSQSAKYCKELLLYKMISDYQLKAKSIGEEYQNITNRALSVPLNTTELMELTAFVEKSKTETLQELEERLQEVIKYILFVSDYMPMTSVEVKTNNSAFQWYYRMPSIFQEHIEIIESKTGEYQNSLRIRIEQFVEDLELYSKQCNEMQYWGSIDEIFRYKKKADRLNIRLNIAMETIDDFNVEEQLFGWELSQYPLRKKIADKLGPYKKFYDAACEFLSSYGKWMNSMVGSYDPDTIEAEVGTAYRTIYKLEKSFQEIEVRKLAEIVRLTIEKFREHMTVIMTLGNPGMKARHWEQVSEIVGFPIKVDINMTLSKIIDFGLDDYVPKFENISEAATKENNLEKALIRMHEDWVGIEFIVSPYHDTGTYIVSGIDDIQLQLDDHVTKTQTMKNSLYIKPFETVTLEWEAKLLLLQDIIDYWLKVQATWMYLEPIFSSPDIQQQMPEEGRRFSAVDKMWREIMSCVEEEPEVMSVVEIEKLLENLKKSTNLLELIQKGLNDYLEKKRLYFPRFFFLSNDELLEILSETKDPTRVQPHLKKCFEGIAKLNFTEDLEVTAMISSEEEQVTLEDIIDTSAAKGQVEKWLLELEIIMKKSVRAQVIRAKNGYKAKLRRDWVLDWPGQTILCISQLYWTSDIIHAMPKAPRSLQKYIEKCINELSEIVKLVRGKLSAQNRTTLGIFH